MSVEKEDSTSSVGAVWPPEEASNNRLRGFYDQVVDSSPAIEEFAGQFDKYTLEVKDHPVLDRLSIRLVANLGAIPIIDQLGIPLEAGMPIRGDEDHFIVYAHWNDTSRHAAQAKLDEHKDLIDQVSKKDRHSTDHIEQLRTKGFVPQVITPETPTDKKLELVDRFSNLYSAFGYDRTDVEGLLLSPANTIAYIENAEGVVSTAMAERVDMDIQGLGNISIAEITEAFTLPSHRQHKLYELVSGYLTRRLIENDDSPLDAIYGESNLTMPGVVIAGHRNGRRFSYHDQDRLGVTQPNFGILQQNFHILDGNEKRPYNDFALSYVTF